MPDDNTTLVQQSFGPNAQKYAESATFAKSDSLTRLVELTAPQPGWAVLDVATGGGHTALAFARHVQLVIATDLTPQMLTAAEGMIRAQGVTNVSFREADAQALPFPDAEFDLVTCRIAPHHFPNVAQFVRECKRVVKPGGLVAVIDNITPPHAFTARYVNAYEKLRDPSHLWAYAVHDWQKFFTTAGLTILQLEEFHKAFDFIDFCERMNVSRQNRLRLETLLRQAPKGPREAFNIFDKGGQLYFYLHEILIIGRA